MYHADCFKPDFCKLLQAQQEVWLVTKVERWGSCWWLCLTRRVTLCLTRRVTLCLTWRVTLARLEEPHLLEFVGWSSWRPQSPHKAKVKLLLQNVMEWKVNAPIVIVLRYWIKILLSQKYTKLDLLCSNNFGQSWTWPWYSESSFRFTHLQLRFRESCIREFATTSVSLCIVHRKPWFVCPCNYKVFFCKFIMDWCGVWKVTKGKNVC